MKSTNIVHSYEESKTMTGFDIGGLYTHFLDKYEPEPKNVYVPTLDDTSNAAQAYRKFKFSLTEPEYKKFKRYYGE